MRHVTLYLGLFLLAGCFEDSGPEEGSPETSTEDTLDTEEPESSSGVEETDATSGVDETSGTIETDDASSGPGTASETLSGSASSCTPAEGCPGDEFCVDGVCQSDPPPNMIVVPGGEFFRGCNNSDCDDDEHPADPDLYVSTFAIDRTEVTAGEYEACVEDGACSAAAIDQPECNAGRGGYEDHPINCVDWGQAETFCAWARKRLPTEAEWEKAARGTDGRRHPWGDEVADCTRMVKVENGNGCGTGETWPVGSMPEGASPYGVLNVAGNVREWVADWYADTLEVDVDDPMGPPTGVERVSRGLALINGSNSTIRISNRSPSDPSFHAFYVGFRCSSS